MQRRAMILILVCVVSVIATDFILRRPAQDSFYRFSNLAGPYEPTIMPASAPARWQDFAQGSTSRLAVLLTDPNANWLGLAHGLKTIGVPFLITTDTGKALRHRVVFVYPAVSGQHMAPKDLAALAQFPYRGGTLIAQHVLGGGRESLFGFDKIVPVTRSATLHFHSSMLATSGLTDPAERVIRIGGGQIATTGTYAYTKPIQKPVATYADGSAAIIRNAAGTAYAFGVDVGYLLQRGYNNRQQDIAARYVNAYEPTLDVLLRCIKNIYTHAAKNSATLATVPGGKALAVLLTHDIDTTRSLDHALVYAAFERSRNITATYFMQTKYVRDWNDEIFFTREGVRKLQKLRALGMEIGSHSVAHAKLFSRFPLGDGTERYPLYAPFVQERLHARRGTILGELRVSRFLLEQTLPGLRVESFRPGHLSNPFSLPEALTATGYRFSSSVTANDSLTHLPFRLSYGRTAGAQTPVFEFPITISDEAESPLAPGLMIDRLPQALALADRLKRYGGLFVILIHPDILGQKLAFEQKFIAAMGDSAWYGSAGQFGRWWAARDEVEADVETVRDGMMLTLAASDPIDGLAVDIPVGMIFADSDPPLRVAQYANRIVIDSLAGQARLAFKRSGKNVARASRR